MISNKVRTHFPARRELHNYFHALLLNKRTWVSKFSGTQGPARVFKIRAEYGISLGSVA